MNPLLKLISGLKLNTSVSYKLGGGASVLVRFPTGKIIKNAIQGMLKEPPTKEFETKELEEKTDIKESNKKSPKRVKALRR